VRQAKGGTLFLDEVGCLAPAHQAKLLQVLDDGTYYRVGDAAPRKSNVRVVAASNRPLRMLVAEGRFRGDLFHRLSALRIELPPLRDRPGAIGLLADHFLAAAAHRSGRPARTLSIEARACLEACSWPGNVRQLKHEVERAVALARGPEIGLDDLSPELAAPLRRRDGSPPDFRALRQAAIDAWERGLVEAGLRRTGGNMAALARELGLARQSLWSKVRKHGLQEAARGGRETRP